MAVSVCSESVSLNSSPRISFSHDLRHADIVPVEKCTYRSDSSLLNPVSDFNFQIDNNAESETSSADELFSQGQIRPIQLQKTILISKQVTLPEILPIPILNETPSQEICETDQTGKQQPLTHNPLHHHQSKSFWRIKRSSSLNCDNNHKKTSFWSLPLLSRSNSTGSVPISKNIPNQKKNHSNVQKQNKNSNLKKPPTYKNYGNGIRINPVLNVPVPPPFISKGTANLFGLGSLFRNGKERKNKK